LEKGVEANYAGTDRAAQCILYIVEGKSASAYPKKRIALTPGNKDFSGYYPIKGKFPNIMKMPPTQIANNKEITEIKKMLQLREGVTYEDPVDLATLRYGLVILTTDMDSDGTHIRLLLIAFFRKWVGLLKHGMVAYLATFAVRVFDGTGKTAKCVGRFSTVADYETWAHAHPDLVNKYRLKYYKGLGTSRDCDIEDDMTTASLVVCLYDNDAPGSIDMAFGKDAADARKQWIATWRDRVKVDDIVFVKAQDLYKYRNITDIINKDLIDYTVDALFRAIPSEEDLIKRSQRQALYYVLENWKYGHSRKPSMKVERIAGAAAEFTKYHHGPKSMIDTIIRMCQDYVGSNNLAYFMQEGQMGTRDGGGDDSADGRYNETQPET
jgi:DNA topoisomerase-2